MPQYVIHTPADEGSTPTLTGQLLDAEGTPVGPLQLDAQWLTLYDSHSLVVINGRTHVDPLTLDGFAMDEVGQFAWVLSPEDMPILDDCRAIETHIVLLEFHWTASNVARVAVMSIALPVRHLVLGDDLVVASTVMAPRIPPGSADTTDHSVMPWGEIEATIPC